MKFPFNTPHNHQSLHPKPLSRNNTAQNTAFQHPTNTNNPCYEPTSVLDRRRSSSPVTGPLVPVSGTPAVAGVFSEEPLPLPLQLDDLDSMVWAALMEKDDSAPPLKNIPQFPPYEPENQYSPILTPSFDPSLLPDFYLSSNQNPNSFNLLDDFSQLQSVEHLNLEFDRWQLDHLIRAAECFESNELQHAQLILARLNQRLRSPVGKPLQRAAFYFKEALQSLLNCSNRTTRFSSSEVVQKIKAYKAFSEISPIAVFSNVTANQALLEALDGAMFVHVIDFDIGLGGHWASFLKEIANRAAAFHVPPSALRITAVISEDSAIEVKLIRDNLCQFARELEIRFQIEFVQIRTFEIFSFKAIKFIDGEMIAVHLSPAIFRHLGSANSIAEFLGCVRRISPRIIVFVNTESWRDLGASSFRRYFISGLEFYSTMLESLDASNTRGIDLMRKIEMFMLRPKIFTQVKAARHHISQWHELLSGAGMVPVPFSQFTDFQAECVLMLTQVKGFHVAKRQAEMLLCWQERELVATSAWRC
ncbi:hypothetical protein HHK36_002446 [Tetracentron sinense]|uniref:Scarecrow-like protein 15 n=1 Tax=Tetracentron sinense TaxID=13715 RepID=A0A834ZWF3_TETSI|nr:hypothetical protein HHK36_002446 [Tetracentron sinense]